MSLRPVPDSPESPKSIDVTSTSRYLHSMALIKIIFKALIYILLSVLFFGCASLGESSDRPLIRTPKPLPRIDYARMERGTKREMVIQRGHHRAVKALAVSPDGKFLVTGSIDHTIKIWRIEDGILLRSLSGRVKWITGMSLSPNGERLAVSSWYNEVVVLNVTDGSTIRILRDHKAPVRSVAFSPDGKFLVSGSENHIILVREASSGKIIQTLNRPGRAVECLAFNPDGRYLASGSSGGDICLWDTGSWSLSKIISGHGADIKSLQFSFDGRFLLSASWDDTATLWKIPRGEPVWTVGAWYPRRVYRQWTGSGYYVNAAALSPDGRYAAVPADKTSLALLRTEDGSTFSILRGKGGEIGALCFTPDGKYLISSVDDGALRLWDLSGKQDRSLKGSPRYVEAAAFSPDGLRGVCGTERNSLRLWDIREGYITRTIEGWDRGLTPFNENLAFSPDGKTLAGVSLNKNLTFWDVKKGKILKSTRARLADLRFIAFSPDGNSLLTLSEKSILKLWNTDQGTLIRRLKIPAPYADLAVFFPDGRRLAVVISGEGKFDPVQSLLLYDIDRDYPRKGFLLRQWGIKSLAVSPDGRHIATGLENTEIRIWNAGDGKPLQPLRGHRNWVRCLTYSPDGKYIASGSWDGTVCLWKAAGGTLVKRFRAHHDTLLKIAFTPDSLRLLTASSDNSLKVWRLTAPGSEPNYTALITSGKDWMIYSQEGLFDCSPEGGGLIAMVKGFTAFGVDQFALRNNRPDLLLERLGNTDRLMLKYLREQHLLRLKKAGTPAGASAAWDLPTAKIIEGKPEGTHYTLRFRLKAGKSPLLRYNLYVNDVPLYGAYGREISGQDVTLTEKIELSGGRNKIEVSCLNAAGAESFRPFLYAERKETGPGRLYFLGFGISQYRDSRLNLKYAAQDALDLAEAFRSMKPYYTEAYIHTFTDRAVTPETIQKARKLLATAGVDDTVVLFIAGHGLHAADDRAAYYFLTHNTDLDKLPQTAASFELLESLLQGISPRKKLFLMDTCESGEYDESLERPYRIKKDGRRIQARTSRALSAVLKKGRSRRPYLLQKERYIFNDLYRRSGAVVISSSEGNEFSYESDDFRNGIFTESLLDALAGLADFNEDGQVSLEELKRYLKETVPGMSGGRQHPVIDRDNLYQKFSFPLSEGY